VTRLLIALIRVYQRVISPLIPPACRFTPTCSNYCIEALRKKGLLLGGWMGVRRILRCNPLFPGGHDPVEPSNDGQENAPVEEAPTGAESTGPTGL
jgi:uncharacterized protein